MAPLVKIAAFLGLSLLVTGQGTQFITGPCTSDADCAAGCCGFNSGKCAGAVIAQTRDGGCGFGDAQPNSNAAQALGFSVQPSASAATPAPAAQVPAPPAPAGTTAAKAPGTQFITGTCTSDGDCASACCGFKSGKCAAPIPAQERDGGCGFGDAEPNDPTGKTNNANVQAVAVPPAVQPTPASTSTVKAPGSQFITGACTADTDCASACCGFTSGKCAAPIPAQERGEGCGFGDAQPNDPTGRGLGTKANVQQGGASVPAAAVPAVAVAPASAPATTPGTQFITGACTSDADCALGCCGFNSGKCAGPVVAQERDGGCGFGDAQPNDNAAQALKGQRLGKRGVVYWM
jgi:hypothetical protein